MSNTRRRQTITASRPAEAETTCWTSVDSVVRPSVRRGALVCAYVSVGLFSSCRMVPLQGTTVATYF